MPKYVQASTFRIKDDMLAAAREEIGRWVAGYAEIGVTATFYVGVGGGSGEALVSVEFPDGATWLKTIEDPRLREARERMTESSFPIEQISSTVWQEVPREA
jgi:hypothetical protein